MTDDAPSALSPARRQLLEERLLAREIAHELGNILYVLQLEQEALQEALERTGDRVVRDALAGQAEYFDRLKDLHSATRGLLDQRGEPPGVPTDLAALARALGEAEGVTADVRADRAIAPIHPDLARIALEDLLAEAGRSGHPVRLAVHLEAAPSRFRAGYTDAVVCISTPGFAAPRDTVIQRTMRHFKGGSARRGADLGASLAHAIVRTTQARFLPSEDVPGDLADDVWFELRWPASSGV